MSPSSCIILPRSNSNGHPISEETYLYLREGGKVTIVDASGVPVATVERVQNDKETALTVQFVVSTYQEVKRARMGMGGAEYTFRAPYDGGEETFENLPQKTHEAS